MKMENDVRLINYDAAIDRYYAEYEKQDICDGAQDRDWLKKCFDEAPTIDPESLRPKGRWEKHWCDNDLIGHMYEVCPNCRSCEILDTEKFWDSNFCPNCGAKLEG